MPDPISNAQQYFGVPETYGTAQDYFPGSESPYESAWRAKLEGRQPIQPATSGDEFDAADYQIAQQTGDPFGVFQAAGALRTQSQANKIVQGLSAINPKMPDFLQRQNEILAQNPYALTDPRVLEMAKLNNSRAALAQPKTPSYKTDLAVQAAQSGVPVDQIRALRQPDGSYDELGLASAMGEVQRKAKAKPDLTEPTIKQKQELVSAFQEAHGEPDDDEKVAALNAKMGTSLTKDKMTPAQWQQSYKISKQARQQKLLDTVDSYQQAGVRLPNALQSALSTYGSNQEIPSGPAQSQASTVPSQPQAATIAPTEETPETPSDPFAALAQTIQQKQAEKNALKAKSEEADNALWEKAKGDLLQKYGSAIDPDKTNSAEDIEGQLFNAIPEEEGDQVAFVDSAGNPHSYKRVLQALGQDPRIQKLSRTSSLAPIVKTPQGRKFTVGAPINVK